MNNQWLYDQLSDLLQFPVPQDMIDYVSSIENVRDLEDYMRTLLDFNNSKHKQFLQELLQRRTGSVGYKKNEVQDDYFVPKQEKKKKEKCGKSQNSSSAVKKEIPELPPAQVKKKKFVNLYSQEGQNRQEVMLKGRHKCDCQASRHKLINNCLKCGRIVCMQEGSGPCLFCSNLVCSREEQELISAGTKQANQLLQRLMDQKPTATGYESAIQHRNKLLEYDRTSEKRTRIIDDESDYFSSHSVWLSPTERDRLKQKEEELQARKHQSRREKKITLDLGLKQLVEEREDFDLSEVDEVLRDISNSEQTFYEADNTNPSVNMQPRFDEDVLYKMGRNSKGSRRMPTSHTKIQDREFLEMVDEGLCLSLHQPWASLLTCGIKEHEGRNWYTSHRGRLWIASAAKAPSEMELCETQQVYSALKPGVVFPQTYPTGCLLGCVNLVDCLPQEEYRQRFPDGESQSPFVFICDSPQELPIRFPITGKHKIYKLDPSIHQAAQKALQRLAKIQSDKNGIPFIRNS